MHLVFLHFFFQAEDGIRDGHVTGVQTCALPIWMGRELDPELDLWDTAQPYLENWMRQRIGLTGLIEQLQKEGSQWSQILPQLPRLTFERLKRPDGSASIEQQLARLGRQMRRTNRSEEH